MLFPPSWCFLPAAPPGTPAARLVFHCSRSSTDSPSYYSAASTPKCTRGHVELSLMLRFMYIYTLCIHLYNIPQQEILFLASLRCMASAWLLSSCGWWGSPEACPRCRWSPRRDCSRLGCAVSGWSLPGGWEPRGWAWPGCLRPPVGLSPGSSARRSPPGCSRSWRGGREGARARRRGTDGSVGRNPRRRSSRTGLPRLQFSGDPERRRGREHESRRKLQEAVWL